MKQKVPPRFGIGLKGLGRGVMRRQPTPSQRVWAELFGLVGVPELDEAKVKALLDSLPERERMAVRLRFGFAGRPLSFREIGERLPRSRGGSGVSRQFAQRELQRALRRLRHARHRKAWEEARTRDRG